MNVVLAPTTIRPHERNAPSPSIRARQIDGLLSSKYSTLTLRGGCKVAGVRLCGSPAARHSSRGRRGRERECTSISARHTARFSPAQHECICAFLGQPSRRPRYHPLFILNIPRSEVPSANWSGLDLTSSALSPPRCDTRPRRSPIARASPPPDPTSACRYTSCDLERALHWPVMS